MGASLGFSPQVPCALPPPLPLKTPHSHPCAWRDLEPEKSPAHPALSSSWPPRQTDGPARPCAALVFNTKNHRQHHAVVAAEGGSAAVVPQWGLAGALWRRAVRQG